MACADVATAKAKAAIAINLNIVFLPYEPSRRDFLEEWINSAHVQPSKVYAQMDEIDGNADLSREDKHHRRSEVMAQTLAEFEASKTLARAREAVRCDASPATLKALKEAEVGWQRAVNKIAERAGRTSSVPPRYASGNI
jgi:hypothetical protein